MKEKKIQTIAYPIRLGQFLKLINLAQDGIDAKRLILEGMIQVNGEIERRRGRQLQKDDIIELQNGNTYHLC